MKKTLLFISLLSSIFSQTDKMFVGEINKKKSYEKSLRTIEKIPFSNSFIIHGKYYGLDWETGEINFVGNDGKLYADPSIVQIIKNKNGAPFLEPSTLTVLQGRKQEIAKMRYTEMCEQNKEINVMVLSIKNDFYGLAEDIEQTMAIDGCYNILSNEKGLGYLYKNNIQLDNINDYLIRKMGESVNADYIIYGYASEYDVPFKYAPASSDKSVKRIDPYDIYDSDKWMNDLLIALHNWAVS